MNPQSIECECGCWNIVVKVVPPEEPCPYCGSTEPHECCPEKAKALGLPGAQEGEGKAEAEGEGEGDTECKTAEPGKKGKYNIFQFERCDCGCSTLHYVEPDEECPSMRKMAAGHAALGGGQCCRIAGKVLRGQLQGDGGAARQLQVMRNKHCLADGKWLPYGRSKVSYVGQVEKTAADMQGPPTPAPCSQPPPCA